MSTSKHSSTRSRVVSLLLSLFLLFSYWQPSESFSINMPAASVVVVVVGSANQDLTSYTPHLPVLGETVLGSTFETSCGGKGANQAIAAASTIDGGDSSSFPLSVEMVCRVGDDVFGRALLDNFAQRHVRVDESTTILGTTSTGVATIVVDTTSGDNMIIVTPGANHQLTPTDVDTALRAASSTTTLSVVVTQLEIPLATARQALQTGRALGATTILNTAPAPADQDALKEFWPLVDILIPNETELRTICGVASNDDTVSEVDLAKSLLEKGVQQAVVCTLGARGAVVLQKALDAESGDVRVDYVDAPADLPARGEPVVDTVGAGDAFCGALASYLALGLPLKDAAGRACGFASMSVRRRGASYPTYDQLPSSLRVPS